jgi:hypothetical protein
MEALRMTRHATEFERADHDRDLLKHDTPSARVRSVAYLTAYLDTLLRLNAIPLEYRDGIRATVDSTRKMFDLPDLGPREMVR